MGTDYAVNVIPGTSTETYRQDKRDGIRPGQLPKIPAFPNLNIHVPQRERYQPEMRIQPELYDPHAMPMTPPKPEPTSGGVHVWDPEYGWRRD